MHGPRNHDSPLSLLHTISLCNSRKKYKINQKTVSFFGICIWIYQIDMLFRIKNRLLRMRHWSEYPGCAIHNLLLDTKHKVYQIRIKFDTWEAAQAYNAYRFAQIVIHCVIKTGLSIYNLTLHRRWAVLCKRNKNQLTWGWIAHD